MMTILAAVVFGVAAGAILRVGAMPEWRRAATVLTGGETQAVEVACARRTRA